jgi:hypothetical protein
MTTVHWAPPDICGDLIREALRADAAEPVVIHVRPEIQARVSQGAGATGIRWAVDAHIPASPGYEIHRAAPAARRTVARPGSPDSDPTPADDDVATYAPVPGTAS